MNTHTTEAPGSLLTDWFQKNRMTLVVFAAVILGLGLYNRFVPQMQRDARMASWEALMELRTSGAEAFEAAQLPETLSRAKLDATTYPWFAAMAAHASLQGQDSEAYAILKPELTALSQSHPGIKVNGENLFGLLASRMSSSNLSAASNPEPSGQKVTLTLTASDGASYALSYGLYASVAPAASAQLLSMIEAGSLIDVELAPAGAATFKASSAIEGEPTSIPLERQFGWFHEAGSLSTSPDFTVGGGAQSGTELLLLFEDAFHQDGRSTVFAKLLNSEILDDLANRAEGALTITDASIQ
jgi:hypothetical protein